MKRRSRHWWGCRTDRCRAVLRWIGPLLGFAVLVAIVWYWHHWRGVAGHQEARRLFLRVGLTYGYAFGVLLIGQRKWNLRALGLLGSIAASSLLDLRTLGRYGPQPQSEAERDLLQSLYDVGSTVLAIGLTVWVIRTRFGRRKRSDEAEAE
jgi:hypothetical protein